MFDEIIQQANDELVHLPDAARAEVWVSAVFGGWRQAGVADGLAPEDIDADVLRLLAANPSEAGLAIALAATAMGIVGAESTVADLRAAGMREPHWHETVGTAQPVSAFIVHDVEVGADSVIIEFVHDDGLGHSMLVEIDEGAAVDVLFGPDGLVEGLELDNERSLQVEPVDVGIAAATILAGFDRTASEADPAVTEEFTMNIVLATARVNALTGEGAQIPVVVSGTTSPAGTAPVRDPDADAYASSTLQAALRAVLALPAPVGLEQLVDRFDELVTNGDPDALLLLSESGHRGQGLDALLASIGAYATPGPLAAFARPHRELIEMLEWADWLGAVIQLVRSGPGSLVTPEALVEGINRCPEVVDTIPKSERRAVETAFDLVLHAWSSTGVIDDEGRLTEVGAWLLPKALLFAWGSGSGDDLPGPRL